MLGSTKLYPYSKPKTANSDKKLSTISNFFCFDEILFNGIYLELSIWFLNTECLWLKVPLPESCPTSLTGYPSSNNEPNARAAAVDQSISLPLFIEFFLASKILTIVLWIFSSGESECILSEISKSLVVE